MLDNHEFSRVFSKGLDLLAIREHSRKELKQKFKRKFADGDDTLFERVLDKLRIGGYQSDERFTENYVRSKLRGGHGPIRVKNELKRKGIADELIVAQMDASDVDTRVILTKLMSGKIDQEFRSLAYLEKQKIKSKVFRQMVGKGYTYKQIIECFNILTKSL